MLKAGHILHILDQVYAKLPFMNTSGVIPISHKRFNVKLLQHQYL